MSKNKFLKEQFKISKAKQNAGNTPTPQVNKKVAPKVEKQTTPQVNKQVAPKVDKQTTPQVNKQVAPKVDKQTTPQVNKQVAPKVDKQTTPQVNKQVAPQIERQTTPENKAASKNSFLINEYKKLKEKSETQQEVQKQTTPQVNKKNTLEENTAVSKIIKETPEFKDTSNSNIPKIIHRIWMTFDPEHPEVPEKYKKADTILKSLHSDWIFMEWNDKKVLNFVHDYYPNFFETYISYSEPVMRHDVARYLILKHFGGVFIQHSFVFQKNIEPLLGSYDLVFSTKMNHIKLKTPEREGELANNWMASTPSHPFWDNLISSLIETAKNPPNNGKNFVMSVTGPFILTDTLKEYQKKTQDPSIHVLHYKYLMPFYAFEQNEPVIKTNCVDSMNTLDLNKCFSIFPNAYAYTPWSASWTLDSHKKASIDLSLLDTTSEQPNYTKLFVMNLKRSSDRWAKISYDLYNKGIKFERFQAADGYKVKILDPETGQSFRGIDIKRKIVELSNNKFYQITCDNGLSKPLDIKLKSDGAALIAGNIGVWCTKALIREEIIENNYNNTIILEDDFEFNPTNLVQNINSFISSLPRYDIAYLHNYIKQRDQVAPVNSLVSSPNPHSLWYGDWAHMLSLSGAQKLNQGYEFIGPSDDYSRKLALKQIAKPGVSEFSAYFAQHNFSTHNDWYYTGHNPNSESTKMGCRSLHPSSQKDCNKKISLDQVYVINLDQATDRLKHISQELANQDIKFIRLPATDGYNIQITDLQNGNIFFGRDIKSGAHQIERYMFYKISCNPDDIHPHEFTFKGYINDLNNTISAGELGVWCSNYRIWIDAKNHDYSYYAVLEDDSILHPNFKTKLGNFLSSLPISFDIGYMYITLRKDDKVIQINKDVNSLNQASGYGFLANVYSAKATDIILSYSSDYTFPVDIYAWCLGSGILRVKNIPDSECTKYKGSLSKYSSTEKLVTLKQFDESYSINNMGRNFAMNISPKINGLDKIYVINLNQATRRWDEVSQKLKTADIPHSRFSATDGIKIKITNIKTGEIFFGSNIKDQSKTLEKDILYKITCNPDSSNQKVEFSFKGYIRFGKKNISAGELGIWCSYRRVWEDAKQNGYKKVLTFEDDIIPSSNFKDSLSKFTTNLPKNANIAFPGFTPKTPSEHIKINDFVLGFSQKAYGHGAYSVIFDSNAIDKLLAYDYYTYPIDNFLWCTTTGSINNQEFASYTEECRSFSALQAYGASTKMISFLSLKDDTSIDNMGRIGDWNTDKEL